MEEININEISIGSETEIELYRLYRENNPEYERFIKLNRENNPEYERFIKLKIALDLARSVLHYNNVLMGVVKKIKKARIKFDASLIGSLIKANLELILSNEKNYCDLDEERKQSYLFNSWFKDF